jgi:hypothetical protein
VPSVEVVLDALVAIVIVSLLALQRRHRIRGDAEPIAVSVATGAVLGLIAVFGGAFVISWIFASA